MRLSRRSRAWNCTACQLMSVHTARRSRDGNTELAAAQNALHHASPLRDLLKPAELQAHLCEVLDAQTLAAWPLHG